MTAPVGEVTMPTVRGNVGKGFLRSASKRPSAFRRSFSCSKASCREPAPMGSKVSAISCICPRCS